MTTTTSRQAGGSSPSALSVRYLLRRTARTSRRKKLVLMAGTVLFVVALVAAYYRVLLVLVPALVLLVVGGVMVVMQLDALLKRARSSAKASMQLLETAPVAAPAVQGAAFGTAYSWSAEEDLTPAKLVQRLTKLRSLEGRDILVRKVTEGQWDWKELESALELYRLGGPARKSVTPVFDSTVKVRLLQVADLCYRQNLRSDDILDAATLYRYVYQKLGAGPFKGKKRGEFYLDALSQTGRGDQTLKFQGLYDTEKLNPHDLHLFRANARNPFRHQSHTGEDWLAEINTIYESEGLVPIRLRPGSEAAFRRLTTDPVPAVEEGPLVSIVMPVFRPDEYTDLAVRSALAQSYANLEIIIVDDGSGEDYAARLDTWEGIDPRVKVIRNTPNSGAYTSRNLGYMRASGQFLTIFDGDDWQHPQKIEKLVEASLQQQDDRLVSSPWSRADADLMFHYRGWRGAYITPAHVSTMFPIAVIREKLGFWDSVRKAADTEFILRYRMVVNNKEPLEVTQAPLTLSLVTSSNLSVEDFRLGYRSPDRVSYRASYEHWHRRIAAGEHNGYLPFDAAARLFPAPDRFLPMRPERREVDVVVVGDFADAGYSIHQVRRAVDDARGQGLSVGVMHMPSIVNTRSIDDSFPPAMMDEFENGTLRRIEITDAVTSREVHVFDPTAFEFEPALRSGQVTGSVIVHASEAPYDRSGRGQRYSVGSVTHNLESIFGAPVRWSATDPRVFESIGRNLVRASDLELVSSASGTEDSSSSAPEEDAGTTETMTSGTRA